MADTAAASGAEHSNYVAQLGSSDPEEVYGALRTIKNSVIGSSTKKALYMRLDVVAAVSAVLTSAQTSVASRIQATAIVGSLARSRSAGAAAAGGLAARGVVAALVRQLSAGTDARLVEASERALHALLAHSETLAAGGGAEDALVAQVLGIIGGGAGGDSQAGARAVIRLELAVLIVARLCVSEARQYMVANTGVIDALVRQLGRSPAHVRLQAATLQALAALSYENAEICAALAEVGGGGGGGGVAAAAVRLARADDALVRLHACRVAANLSRMRALAAGDVQAVVVPALVRLVRAPAAAAAAGAGAAGADVGADVGVEAVQALGYVCHEDADVQAAARAAGAIDALVGRLAAAWAAAQGDFGDAARFAREARAAFLALGTVVSTNEESRRAAVDAGAFAHIVRALGHGDAGVRAAACLCARYIVRSVAICRTHAADAGLLRPLVGLLRDASSDVQATAAATLVNLLSDFSPLRADALRLGLLPTLAALLDAAAPAVRRNALWAVRNLLVNVDDATRAAVVEAVGMARLLALSEGADAAMREHAVGALRNVAADSAAGCDAVFAARGPAATLALLAALAARPDAPADRAVLVHALYLANNIVVRSDAHRAAVAAHVPLVQAVVAHVASRAPEVAVAALWCVSSVAAGGAGDAGGGAGLRLLRRLGVAQVLARLLADPALPLEVQDRVKGCMDYFGGAEPGPDAASA
ncbi:hypothetical protein LPJ53_005703 [Coemansia erecta]|uniref:Armadillo repeat-containing protein 8 n=1 Tax=Coemansia erecta TaxID=147472 RepID=A0A9W7XVQ1_9FUNG|nr:hypothetical protein LPJ53_005703 [Coemansia erecta]